MIVYLTVYVKIIFIYLDSIRAAVIRSRPIKLEIQEATKSNRQAQLTSEDLVEESVGAAVQQETQELNIISLNECTVRKEALTPQLRRLSSRQRNPW